MTTFLEKAKTFQSAAKYITLFSNLNTKELAEIVVVGEFSNGKSTLVNALIGNDILPTGIGSVTANITTLKKGNTNQLQCDSFFQKDIAIGEIKLAIEKLKNDKLNKINIELENFPFKDYVIVDTPGINDQNRERELITYEYAPKCDAMIFVLDIARGFTKYEKDFFNDLSETAKDKIFIVLNKYDVYDHIEDLKIENMLKNQGISKDKAFVISSKMAISSIQSKDHDLLKRSGILTLRQELLDYVDKSQSRIVLKKRKNSILDKIKELCITEIDSNTLSLKMNFDEIELSIRALEHEASEAKIESEKIIDELNKEAGNISEKVNAILARLKKDLSDNLFYKSQSEIRDFVQSGKYAKIVSSNMKDINSLLGSDIPVELIELKENFILQIFEKLPFLKEMSNFPIDLDDIEKLITHFVKINPLFLEYAKKYAKKAFEIIDIPSIDFSSLQEKIDDSIFNIENSVRAEIDKYISDKKLSLSYKEDQLNSKIKGAKKAQEEKVNQKVNIENIINENENLKYSLLESYTIELANLN